MALKKDTKIELVRSIPLFAEFSKSDLQKIARIAEEIEFEPEALLMREGETGHEVFVVVSGQLEVWRRRAGGKIADPGPGEVVGEMALLSKKPRNATVRAATPVHLLRIKDTDFIELLDQLPALWPKIASALADRVSESKNCTTSTDPGRRRRSNRLLGYLPDVATGIAEAGRSESPGAIYRAVEKLDPAALQLIAHLIHVLDTERELVANTRLRRCDGRGRDKAGRLTRSQQIDERLAELEHG